MIFKDSDKLSITLINSILYKKGGAIDGGCMILEPNKNMYNKFLKYVENTDIRKFNSIPLDDETLIFSFYISNNIN